MADEWDVYPGVAPPYYAHLERFGNRNLSAEELAAAKERIRKDYERRCEEAHCAWLPRRVELVWTLAKSDGQGGVPGLKRQSLTSAVLLTGRPP
jgi:hypothetical protein